MPGIVGRVTQFGRRTQRIRDALGGAFVVGGEGDTDVAIVQHGIVGAVGFLDLIKRLRDQKALDAVTGHEGECGLEKIQPSQRGEFVEHQQQTMPAVFGVQFLGEPPPDLVEDQPDQRLGAVDVGGRHNEIEADRRPFRDEIGDAPVAAVGHLSHHGIAVEAEKRHRGGENARAFVVRLVEELAGGRRDDGVNA